MARYLVGDVQGCYLPYERLRQKIGFSKSRDHLYLLGDMVNRGPDSLQMLRHVRQEEASVHCVLGNHDLHLLAVAHGVKRPSKQDTLQAILDAPDRHDLLHWLQRQPLARHLRLQPNGPVREALLVHAGVLPSWSVQDTLAFAHEVSEALHSDDSWAFFKAMYGDRPTSWHPLLTGLDRLRMITNVLTRLRFCTADDTMDFATKEGPGAAPQGFMPWFALPNRKTAKAMVAFGHWSTLGLLQQPNLLGLDTGCAWGAELTAIELHDDGSTGEPVQVSNPLP